MWLSNIPLQGEFVTLQPLSLEHIPLLKNAVSQGEDYRLWYANVPNPQSMQQYVEEAINGVSQGNIAYAVINNLNNEVVGTTRFYHVDNINHRALIGYTWYAQSVKRTAINTETKYLLLNHLFDTHDAIAVEFRTHFHNHTSRRAIERLGAKFDGILRHHQILKDGSIRDTVIYSIINSEWPAVKNNLRHKLQSY